MIRSSEQLLYSRSAAARIFGVGVEHVKKVEVWPKVVLVVFQGCGRRPRFVSKQTFKFHFTEFRRQSALGLLVVGQQGSKFDVLNPSNGHQYQVVVATSGIKCTCEDYQNQIQYLGRGCCKHAYRVLFHLGFKTLKDYIQSKALERLRVVLNSG